MTEFDDVIRRLEDGRPQATARELDEIKQRVRRRAANPSRRNQFMKSRLAILGMLVTGMLFSTAGAGLALSGIPSQENASISQYVTPTPQGGVLPAEAVSTPQGGVLPAQGGNAPQAGGAPAAGGQENSGGNVLPAQESNRSVQPARQAAAAAQTSQLPFTGFAAVPVLLGGLALLAGGLLLRRRTREQ